MLDKLAPAVYQYRVIESGYIYDWVNCNYNLYEMYKDAQEFGIEGSYKYEVRRLYSEFDLKDTNAKP